jgi:Cu/Ag efflux pump CusA
MFAPLVGWSLRFRFVVLGLAGVLMTFGVMRLGDAPVDVVPEYAPPYVEIQTEALGLSADEVEQLITVPLEADLLHGVAFLDEIHSESVAGLSSIVLVFEPGTELYRARQVVAERLTQAAALPNVSRPPVMIQPLSSASRVLLVSLSSDEVPAIELSVLAQWTVRQRLLGVPGVANVAIWGQRDRQMQVLVDPERLRSERVLLQHVVESTGNALWVSPLTFLDASTPGAGGFIDTPNQRLSVQHVFPIETPEDLAQVPIAPEDTGGRIVRLGDVATIVEDHPFLIGDALVDDGPGLMLLIEKFPDADTVTVTRGVEDALAALGPGLTGVRIDTTVFRPATYIEEATGSLALALLAGFILAALTALVYFRGWRPALIVAIALPVSLVAAALVVHAAGMTVNAVVVAGIVLALIVALDGMIGAVDALARRLAEAGTADGPATAERIQTALSLDAGRAAYVSLCIALVCLPLLVVGGGAAGAFLSPFVAAFLVALACATVVGLTFTPAVAALSGPLARRDDPPDRVIGPLRRGTSRVLETALRRSGRTVAGAAVFGAVVVLVAGAALAGRGGDAFVGPFNERDLLVRAVAAPGTTGSEMTRILARAGAELRSLQGVRNVGGHVGRAVSADRVVGVDAGELWVSIDPSADYDGTLAAIGSVIDGYPGLERTIITYSGDHIATALAGSADDLVVRVYGQELSVLRAKADEIAAALSGIDGLTRATVEPQIDTPTVEIEVDLAAAERHGIKPGDVRRLAATLLSGIVVGSLFEEQKVFEVVVWGTADLRHSPTSVEELLIQTPFGDHVPLGDIADVRVGPSPAVIRREGVFRRIDVGATGAGRDPGAVLADVEARLAAIDFPLEYRAEVFPLAIERQSAWMGLLGIAAAVGIGVLLLLQAAFGSWRRGLLVIALLPAAASGALAVAAVLGGVSLAAIGGVVGTIALGLRAALRMVDRCQQAEREEGAFSAALVARVSRDGLTSVLGTAVAVALATLPAIVLGDRAGLEIVRPMAAVLLGGVLSVTLVNLFAVPAAVLVAGPNPEPDAASQLIEQPGLSPA